jgi:ankyrin repeat protein
MPRNRNGGHAQVVKVLLENGAEAKAKSREGWTSSSLAKKKGHNEIVLPPPQARSKGII